MTILASISSIGNVKSISKSNNISSLSNSSLQSSNSIQCGGCGGGGSPLIGTVGGLVGGVLVGTGIIVGTVVGTVNGVVGGLLNAPNCVITPGFIYTPLVDSLDYNDVQKLLPITTDDASKYIIDGISRNDAIISFPPLIYCLSHFVTSIPPTLRDAIISIANSLVKYPDFSKPLTHYSHHSHYSTNESKIEYYHSSSILNSQKRKDT
ncbi:hypothetical protein ACTFIZ_001786 [Dictyostelium cf. discoideum]